jgi:NAD(P)H-nitrite reductase large subunit
MTTDYICHCFKYSRDDLVEDVRAHGRSTIMARIIAESKAAKCNCAKNNPTGR